MTKLHNRYRRAKRFKLDEDLDVADEFSGNHRNHGKDRWRHDNKMWDSWGIKTKRFFRSRVGQNWDVAYSDFCNVAKQEGNYTEHWLRDFMKLNCSPVEENIIMIDGYPHEQPMWRHYGSEFKPLWKGGLYVDPVTKLLCVAKGLKQELKPSRFPQQDKVVEVGDAVLTHNRRAYKVAYKHRSVTYNRRVGCGVLEEVVEKVWFKYEPYLYSWVDRWGKFVGCDERGCTVYEAVTKYEVRYQVTTASKREIKQHKLNEANS